MNRFYLLKKISFKLRMVMFLLAMFVHGGPAMGQLKDWDQPITITLFAGSLEKAIQALEEKTGTKFIFSAQDIETKKIAQTQHYENAKLSSILKAILTPLKLTHKWVNNRVVIKPVPHTPVGQIQGRIRDKENNELLVGANVQIEGTTVGTTANVEGGFTISNLPVGKYTLLCSFIGYKTQRLEGVTVSEGNITSLNIALEQSTSSLNEVVVKGSIDVRYTPIENSTENSLISDIRDSDNIVTGISNLQITRSLDRDASDVMRRVPGVTVLNNFVLVRGMNPRYNITYLNDMLVPSTESDSRAFSFNLIPSGLVDDIKIYKLPSPELPGGFGGGVIKVNTKKSQATRHIQVDLSAQYRTGGASFADYYTGSNNSKKDWMAMGLKDRRMPSQFYDRSYQLPRADFYTKERMDAIRTMPAVNQIKKDRHSLDRRFSLNYYDSWKLGELRLNNLTSLGYTYQGNSDFRWKEERGTNTTVHQDGTIERDKPEFQAIDSIYTEEVRLSLLENLNLSINEKHSLSLNLFANRSAEDNTLLSAESNASGGTELLPNAPPPVRNASFEYRVRDLISLQLSGDHRFGDKHKLHWFGGQIQQIDETPDWQIYKFYSGNEYPLYNLEIDRFNRTKVPRQYYFTKEINNLGGLDYSVEINPWATLKGGIWLQNADRSFDNINYTYTVDLSMSHRQEYENLYQPWLHIASIFRDENFKDDGSGFDMDITYNAGSYSFQQDITAGYLAGRFNVLKDKVELYGGLRYEHEYSQLFDADGNAVKGYTFGVGSEARYVDIPGPDSEYFLPSLNVTWNLNNNHKLRAGYGRTIDRPAFRERSRVEFLSIREGLKYTGNDTLTNSVLDNYDFRWEWYPTTSEFIAIGGYYKYIDKPIEVFDYGNSASERLRRTWNNKRWAELYGVELEIRKNLSFIPLPFSSHFSVIMNASYIYTQVREDIDLMEGGNISVRPSRPLTGSSPFVANINLYYENPLIKTVVGLSYNYIAERLISTSTAFLGNLHEQEQHLIDFVIIQPIGKYLKLKGGIQNILNRDIVRWRDGNFDGSFTPGELKPVSQLIDPEFEDRTDHEGERWNPGSYCSLGLTFTF